MGTKGKDLPLPFPSFLPLPLPLFHCLALVPFHAQPKVKIPCSSVFQRKRLRRKLQTPTPGWGSGLIYIGKTEIIGLKQTSFTFSRFTLLLSYFLGQTAAYVSFIL